MEFGSFLFVNDDDNNNNNNNNNCSSISNIYMKKKTERKKVYIGILIWSAADKIRKKTNKIITNMWRTKQNQRLHFEIIILNNF